MKSVIDIGTNSVRLLIMQDDKVILKELRTTRLGEGISKSNIMSETAMKRTADAVCEFVQKAKKSGSTETYIYGTAMVRESSNKSEFTELVKKRTGIDVEVISGETEAKIAYLGAAKGHKGYAVIDIGGGSTEVVTNSGGEIKALSQRIGCVRLKESFDKGETVDCAEIVSYCKKHFVSAFEQTDVQFAHGLIGVSGTPTTIASLVQGIKEYRPQKIQDYPLSLAELKSETQKLALMTLDERKKYSGDFADRADIIVFGASLLIAFMEYYRFESILVSDRDSLEGFLEYKAN